MFFQTFERIKSIATRHSGKIYSSKGFTHLLRCQLRDPKLRFYTKHDSAVEKGNFWIGGEYRPHDDELGEPCIHVVLTYPTNNHKTYINKIDWDTIAFHLADVLTHEYIHRYYIRKRQFKFGRGYKCASLKNYNETMQDYLGCEDEIIAHAFNVASESVVYDREIEKTKVYRLYRKHFRQDQKVVLQLKKQAVKYIKELEQQCQNQPKRKT